MNLHPSCWIVASVALFIGPAAASEDRRQSAGLADRVIEHRLANGLTLLMVPRPQAPVVSINVTFKVGGMDERSGQTGVAHLYEHMAFKGTERIGTTDYEQESKRLEELDRLNAEIQKELDRLEALGQETSDRLDALRRDFEEVQQEAGTYVVRNELSQLYQRHGGVGLNATTGKDVTRYFISLPANRMPLWAAIEADRMANPVFREFYKERAVVMEERRLRTDDNPSGLLYETFIAAAFQAHSYGFPTIGWASDLKALTPDVTRTFFQTYYGPSNAVIAIVGDIQPPQVIALVEKTFGQIKPSPPPPTVITSEPKQRGERRVEVEFDAEPMMFIGYHKPSIAHPDDFVFDVIDAVLSQGVTSRLYRSVVREKRVASSIGTSSSVPGARASNLFMIRAVPLAPHTAAEVEGAVEEELERLKRDPVEARELEKVLNNLDADLIRSLRSNQGLASQLAYFHTVAGDWRYLLDLRDKIAAVTPEDIQRVASEYFTRTNRTVAILVKPADKRI